MKKTAFLSMALSCSLLLSAASVPVFAGEAPEDLVDTSVVDDIVVTWPSMGQAPADLTKIEDAVNEITEEKIGVHVILEPIAFQDLVSQQQLLISSGEQLDIPCMLWTGLDTWVNTESLLELEDLLPTYGAGIVEQQDEKAYACSLDGHVYGISQSGIGYASGFIANSTILEKYGIDTTDRVVTVDELEEIFATVKEGEGSGFYCVARGCGFDYYYGRYDNVGASDYTGVVMFDGDTDTIVDLYETDEFREYAERMYDWAQKGYISPDAATTADIHQTLIATGNYLGGFTNVGAGVEISYGSGGAIPMTSLTLVEGRTRVSDLTAIMFGISSTCENPEKAMVLLNELYTNSDISDLLTSGIEGVHYEVVEELDNGWKNVTFPEGVDMSNSGYFASLGVWDMAATTAWLPAGAALFEEKEEGRNYPYSPVFGYVFDSTEYSTTLSALSSVYSEYEPIISCGAIDPADELPAFINALKAAGIDDMVAANQEQFDAWRAEQ